MKNSALVIAFLMLLPSSAFSYEFKYNCTSNCTAPVSTGQVVGFVAAAVGLMALTFGGLYWVNERLAQCDEARIMADYETYGTPLNGAT